MKAPGYLVIENNQVVLYNYNNMRVRTYYTGTRGKALRADWLDMENESIEIQLEGKKPIWVNRGCQIYKDYN